MQRISILVFCIIGIALLGIFLLTPSDPESKTPTSIIPVSNNEPEVSLQPPAVVQLPDPATTTPTESNIDQQLPNNSVSDQVTQTPPTPVTVTTPEPAAQPKPVSEHTNSTLDISWGVFTGSNTTVIREFESRVTENPDYLAYFVHWGNGEGALPSFLSTYAAKKDRTLVLFWEASDFTKHPTDQPDFSHRRILRGDWDTYIKDFAQQLDDYAGDVILIPFSELNGNWTPWSGTTNGNTPAEAVAAYRHIHAFFDDVTNVQFGWAVNAVSVPQTAENQIGQYYPGDEYVDIVGVDGFNYNNPWLTPDEIFTKALNAISVYNKPMMVFSFGSAAGAKKADWLHEALYEVFPRYSNLVGFVYFNQDKEQNWLLWSDDNTFKVFTDYISQ